MSTLLSWLTEAPGRCPRTESIVSQDTHLRLVSSSQWEACELYYWPIRRLFRITTITIQVRLWTTIIDIHCPHINSSFTVYLFSLLFANLLNSSALILHVTMLQCLLMSLRTSISPALYLHSRHVVNSPGPDNNLELAGAVSPIKTVSIRREIRLRPDTFNGSYKDFV